MRNRTTRTDTECGCIKGVQTCKYHLDRQPRTVAPRDREDAPDRGITYEPETAYEQGFEGDLPRYFVAYGDHGEYFTCQAESPGHAPGTG